MPPFHGFQALNGDEAKVLELLLKEIAGELGLAFNTIELSEVTFRLEELDQTSSLMQPESLSFDERRMRMQAIEPTAYSAPDKPVRRVCNDPSHSGSKSWGHFTYLSGRTSQKCSMEGGTQGEMPD